MATETKDSVKFEKLTHTKKFDSLVANKDLYSLPVTAVPGCGFLLGMLMKRENICRASDLYAIFKSKKEKEFTKFLVCKFGAWNAVYVKTVVRAFEDWEKANVVKPEKKPKASKEEKPKGPPHKVGPGSKKWNAFLQRADLSKTSIRQVPGVASILGCEMEKRGYCNAQQLMDQFVGTKKSQCKGDEKLFHKWILCCFGYWNTQYSKAVVEALKAYGSAKDPSFWDKVVAAGEKAAEGVNNALVKQEPVKEEAGNAEEDNENQGEAFAAPQPQAQEEQAAEGETAVEGETAETAEEAEEA